MARRRLFARQAPTPRGLHARQWGHPGSAGIRPGGEVASRSKIPFDQRQEIYTQNPFYRNGVLMSTGDAVREWFDVVDPADGETLEAEDREFQAWARSINLKRKLRDTLVQGHVHRAGILEFVYDDDTKPDEAPTGDLVDVNILPRKTTRLVLKRGDDGTFAFGAKHRPLSGKILDFHPDRVHVIEVHPDPENLGGLSTAEAAYHDAMSYIQTAQSLGEIVRHHGPGFKHARVLDNDDDVVTMLKNIFAGKGERGDGSGQQMLRGIATGSNVEMESFDASSLDVQPFVEAMRMGVASALGLPVAYLEGVQAGAVSGSQTNRAFIQDQVTAGREFNLDPCISRILDLRFPGRDVDHAWRPFASLPLEEAAMFRDRAGGVEALVRAGVPLAIALRESGIEVTGDDLAEARPGGPGPFFTG